MEEQHVPERRDARHRSLPHRKWVLPLLALLLVGVVGTIVIGQIRKQQASLLPAAIARDIHGFKPYFYAGQVPAGYKLDETHTTYNQGMLFAQFTRGSGETIALTEQAFPTNLSKQSVQQNGDAVRDTAGEATINNVEGRLVGTFVSSDGKTLVLLTSPVDSSKVDLTLLLQGLRAKK